MTSLPPPPENKSVWLSKKYKIVLATLIGAILVVAIVAGTSLIENIPSSNSNNALRNITPTRVVLNVDGSVTDGNWIRDGTTDLPDYESTVSYSISNFGNRDATSVTISISIDGSQYSTNVIPLIAASDSYSSSFSYSTPYDQTNNVLIQAVCQDSADSSSLAIGSNFPRSMPQNPGVLKLYITPKESSIVNMKNSIVNSKFFLTPDWIAIRDWVGGNIHYEFDSVSHGQDDYWQLPKETLALRTGDCEDSAILLATLLRADGMSASDVYVFVGKSGENGHAWVSFKWLNILGVESWIRLEPTSGGDIVSDFFSDLAGTFEDRQIYYSFNDIYYKPY